MDFMADFKTAEKNETIYLLNRPLKGAEPILALAQEWALKSYH